MRIKTPISLRQNIKLNNLWDNNEEENTQQPMSTYFSLGTQQALGIKAAHSIHQEEFICPLESIYPKVPVVCLHSV